MPACHAVDRDALVIWTQFHPLPLATALAAAVDEGAIVRELRLQGDWRLASQIDTTHWFFYGHRYWPAVKRAVVAAADRGAVDDGDLATLVSALAADVAREAGTTVDLTTAIVCVGLMTQRQVGRDAFAAQRAPAPAGAPLAGTPDAIVAARQADDRQGALGFLRGQQTRFSVIFDERRRDGRFTLINGQHLTTAAALDRRDYTTTTGVRSSHEGPIPCDCRSASCGTCWIGVLGGTDKLSPVEPLEQRRLIEFGYWQGAEERPPIRLACMAQATGNVTLVIPTWHGRVGRVQGQ